MDPAPVGDLGAVVDDPVAEGERGYSSPFADGAGMGRRIDGEQVRAGDDHARATEVDTRLEVHDGVWPEAPPPFPLVVCGHPLDGAGSERVAQLRRPVDAAPHR